jgi:hypothetical protein
MVKKKTAEEMWRNNLSVLVNKVGLAEQSRVDEQPGAVVRECLRNIRDAQLGLLGQDWPKLYIRRGHEGD